MTKLTKKRAMELSIAKWEMVARKMIDSPRNNDKYNLVKSCALCSLYISNVCKDCPVSQYTKATGCEGTPLNIHKSNIDEAKDMVVFLKKVQKKMKLI